MERKLSSALILLFCQIWCSSNRGNREHQHKNRYRHVQVLVLVEGGQEIKNFKIIRKKYYAAIDYIYSHEITSILTSGDDQAADKNSIT